MPGSIVHSWSHHVDPRVRLGFDLGNYGAEAVLIHVHGRCVKILILAVVHSKQQRDYGRVVIQKVSFDSSETADSGARLAIVAGDLVAAPAGVDEGDPSIGIVGSAIVFYIRCVKSLLGYAVAIEHDAVAVFKSKLLLNSLPSYRWREIGPASITTWQCNCSDGEAREDNGDRADN